MKWNLKDFYDYYDRDELLESLDAEMKERGCGMCDRVIALKCILSEVKECRTSVLVVYPDANVEVYDDWSEVNYNVHNAEYFKINPYGGTIKVYQMEG